MWSPQILHSPFFSFSVKVLKYSLSCCLLAFLFFLIFSVQMIPTEKQGEGHVFGHCWNLWLILDMECLHHNWQRGNPAEAGDMKDRYESRWNAPMNHILSTAVANVYAQRLLPHENTVAMKASDLVPKTPFLPTHHTNGVLSRRIFQKKKCILLLYTHCVSFLNLVLWVSGRNVVN